MKLDRKIAFSFLTAIVVPLIILMFFFYTTAKDALEERICEHLKTAAESKAKWIASYLAERKSDTSILALSDNIKTAFEKLKAYHDGGGAAPGGPYDLTTQAYKKIYSEIDPFFRRYAEGYGYYDIIFICAEHGHVMYAAAKEADLGVNLNTGSLKDSALAKLWSKVIKDKKVLLADFEYYAPSNETAMFVGTPIFDEHGQVYAVVALQVSHEQINKVMQGRIGLGQTGETYLVGQDLFMRSDSRFSKESSILKQKVDTENVRDCFEHEAKGLTLSWRKEIKVFLDYRGVSVLGTHAYIPETEWALLAEIDAKEAFAPLAKLKVFCITAFCSILTIICLISILISKVITGPIHRLHKGTEIIGQGDMEYKVGTNAKDEIGQLSRAFDQMTSDLKNTTTSIDNLNREIARREQTEKELEISNRDLAETVKKLEEVNCKLNDFVYIASHDLREPLRKISSFGQLLKQSLEGSLVDDDKENLEFMVDGADRMTAMIEGLLVYSRIDTQEAVFETVDLNEVVEQLRRLELAELLEETGAIIEVPESLPQVQANPVQLRQLMQNLIINGIKYRRQAVQPRIVIKATQSKEDTVRIEVQDNGIGIDEEHYENIFTMFRRLHSRQKYEGTGIGLSVCKKIVERHNGQIGVESKVDEGSTFWFTLSSAKEAMIAS
ncbi:MAG: sensor histidine kinase [Planctomycetota bacterium]